MSVQIQTLGCVVAFLGCERNPPPPPSPARIEAPERLAAELGLDAAEIVAPVDPPAGVGDLAQEIARFTTVQECVSERAKLDPLVGDALEAIGYDTFLRDACRVLAAAKAKRREGCADIVATGLRDRCEVLVALVAGDPALCPLADVARPTAGRLASCIAAVTRDARACAGDAMNRATCEALATGNPARCTGASEQVARCRRELARVSPLLRPAAATTTLQEVPRGELAVTAKGGAPPPTASTADLSQFGRAGVVLAEVFDGYRVEPATGGALDVAPGLRARVTLVLGRGEVGSVRVDRFELEVPGVGSFTCPSARCEVHASAKLARPPQRGAPLELRVDANAISGGGSYDATWSLSTFVRDVVELKPR